ncbi:MAG TPA: TetR/AcrR family transcriptional regulator [Acidimicrobiales bacterium]|nr:TetR/AcrR family transcriptional regulator [Acidimicrobiales bacterium]
MARSGAKRRVGPGPSTGSEETRRVLVGATIEALREEGFSGTSAREIARRAGCNQGLVFYHFGSVTNLLLAALDEVSALRLARYQGAVDEADDLGQLVATAESVFVEDLDAGFISVLTEMMAGASSTPGLGAEVAARIAPWRLFAADAMRDTLADTPFAQLVAPEELAHAVVALYLGLEMLAHLDGDRSLALALFERARQIAGLLGALSAVPVTKEEP